MAVFNKKGGSQGGSGPLRWLPVGSGFNLLRLMFQSPGSPSGPFKNPAYKSYIAKISNEPLDFLMPDRSIVTARCVWIISGGRPSQHGFHLVIIANGRENLQKLTGQEGVSSRHFSADLIADAARADAAERSSAPIPSRQVTIKPKVKPVAKPVDDFSDLSGGSEDTTEKAVFPDEPARPAPKKAQATGLGSAGTEDEFAESGSDAGKLASTDLSDLDGGESLDFQKYESGKSKGAAAPKDDDFLSTPSEDELETSSAPSLIRSDVKVPQDTGFLSDISDDPVMVQTGGRTWSLDDESSAAKPQPASEPPVSGDLLESTEPELEAPAEPEVPAEEELLPEEPEAPAEVPVASADDNPFGGEEPVLAAVSAPPVEAEPVPEDNPFEELDTKAAAVPEPVPVPAAEEGNPFEDLDAAPAASSPVEAEPSGSAGGTQTAEIPAAASAPVDDTPGWDFSDDHPAAPAPAPVAAAPEPVKAAEPEAPPVSEPETDEFSPSAPAAESSIFEDEKSGDPFPVSAAISAPAPAPEAEEPVAMDDFSQEADQMAARVAGESDGGNLLEEPPAPVDVEPPRAEAAPAAAVQVPAASVPADEGFGGEPMFADETEAALGEAEALTDPEMLLARSKAKQPAVPSAPVQDDNAFAHDDVAYLDGLPNDAATAGDIRSAHVRQLDDGAAPAPSRFDELRAKGAPEAFDDEAVPVGDDVSDAEDIFGGENTKVTKLANSEFPEEAGNGRDMDSAAAADLRYTNFNTEEATAKAIAEADSIMSAEEFFKDEAPGGPAAAPAASEPAPEPEPEPARAAVPETPAEPPAPVRPSGNWRPFTTEVSNELKGRAKQAKVLERAPDMLRFDLKVRVLWPGNDLTEGVLCVKDRAPSVYLSASDIRKIAPDAEVEF